MRTTLNGLLNETIDEAAARARHEFDRLCAGASGLVLFGAGNLGRRVLGGLRRLGVEPLAFADNNPRLWGTSVEQLPVLRPDDAASFTISLAASYPMYGFSAVAAESVSSA